MNLGQLSITRPILAMVMSIVLVIVGAIAYTTLPVAEYPQVAPPTVVVTTHLPGRLRANRVRHRCRPDRAADQRRRGHAVSLQPGDLERPAHDYRYLQTRHRSRQGPGAGAEPRRDRAAATARRSAAQRRRHPQEQPRSDDGRVHAVAGRHVRPALHQQLLAAAGPRSVAAARRHRRYPDLRRARLFDAAVARSRTRSRPRDDRG